MTLKIKFSFLLAGCALIPACGNNSSSPLAAESTQLKTDLDKQVKINTDLKSQLDEWDKKYFHRKKAMVEIDGSDILTMIRERNRLLKNHEELKLLRLENDKLNKKADAISVAYIYFTNIKYPDQIKVNDPFDLIRGTPGAMGNPAIDIAMEKKSIVRRY